MTEPDERRIPTTHVGSLPRPSGLVSLLLRRERAEFDPGDEEVFDAAVSRAVGDVVGRQVAAGLDVVNDGEMGKPSYVSYGAARLTGFGGEGSWDPLADVADFPGFASRYAERSASVAAFPSPACVGPVAYRGHDAVRRDLDRLGSALAAAGKGPGDAFVTAASPGVIAHSLPNAHYPSEDEYLAALAGAMREEYRIVVEAGFILQLDCPDLAMGRHTRFASEPLAAFRRWAATHVEALNHALDGLPPERLRLHACWGNYDGPHHRDVPLAEIVDILLAARPAGLSFEAANPRHAHEWRVWEETKLPDGKHLIPGVIDTTTNYIEHPDLVAERIARYARIVGRERVVAGADCGLSTFAGYEIVEPEIAWAKLGSLVEGARRASEAPLRRVR